MFELSGQDILILNKLPWFLSLIVFYNAQVKQDSIPEETTNYTLRLVGTHHARIDQSARHSSVVVVSSDYPYGIIDFAGQASYSISENVGHVSLDVRRNRGHIGMLLVTIDVTLSGATEGIDFEVSPKGMIDICAICVLIEQGLIYIKY